eukprot:tig00000404_g417.t1
MASQWLAKFILGLALATFIAASGHPASAAADQLQPSIELECQGPRMPWPEGNIKPSAKDMAWLAQTRMRSPSGDGTPTKLEGVVSSLTEEQRRLHLRRRSTEREFLGPEPPYLLSDFADEEGARALQRHFIRIRPLCALP